MTTIGAIVGFPRSGTSFLSLSLGEHKQVYNVTEPEVLFRYVSEVAQGLVSYSDDEIQDRYSLLWNQRDKKSATVFLNKCHNQVLIVDDILQTFPNFKFIHIIRDGRDVVASALKNPSIRSYVDSSYVSKHWNYPQTWTGLKSPEEFDVWLKKPIAERLATMWVHWVNIGLKNFEKHQNSVLTIRYRDLIRDPDKYSQLLCDFLQIHVEHNLFYQARLNSIGKWKHSKELTCGAIDAMMPLLTKLDNIKGLN